MIVLVAIVLYVIALLLVLLLVGGVRRGDELHARSLRDKRNASLEPADTPTPVRRSPPWSKALAQPGQAPADVRGRSALRG